MAGCAATRAASSARFSSSRTKAPCSPHCSRSIPMTTHLQHRVAGSGWTALADELNEHGNALTGRLLSVAECREIADLYDESRHFRTTIDMARHRFGSGQYRYFTHDLPGIVREL